MLVEVFSFGWLVLRLKRHGTRKKTVQRSASNFVFIFGDVTRLCPLLDVRHREVPMLRRKLEE